MTTRRTQKSRMRIGVRLTLRLRASPDGAWRNSLCNLATQSAPRYRSCSRSCTPGRSYSLPASMGVSTQTIYPGR